MKNDSVVVSYWAGSLPRLCELHFRSFLKQNDGRKYILFLDSRLDFDSKIPQELSWIIDEPNIKVDYINLENLMSESGIAPFRKWKGCKLEKYFRKLKSKFMRDCVFRFPFIDSEVLRFIFRTNFFGNYNSDLRQWTPSHNSFASGLESHLTYRSDLFRSLIHRNFPGKDCLYVDLDSCFIRNFSDYSWENSFVSPWGTDSFANTSCLFLSTKDSEGTAAIVRKLADTSSAWPWELYTKENCESFRIEIRGIEQFDPPWTPGSLLHGDPEKFFTCTDESELIIQELKIHCFFMHWHNRWLITPEKGSPYDLLLREAKMEN